MQQKNQIKKKAAENKYKNRYKIYRKQMIEGISYQ